MKGRKSWTIISVLLIIIGLVVPSIEIIDFFAS